MYHPILIYSYLRFICLFPLPLTPLSMVWRPWRSADEFLRFVLWSMTPGSNPKIILYRKKYIFRFKMKTYSTMSILMRFYIIMISTKECIFQNRNKSDYEINLGEKNICISYLLTSLISSSLPFFIFFAFLPSFFSLFSLSFLVYKVTRHKSPCIFL